MDIKALIREIPDYPKPGVSFKDLTPVLADGRALEWIVGRLAERYRGRVDAVVGIESRGFLVGAPVAYALGTGITVIRKAGKLPRDTHSVSYELEYGSGALEMHTDALLPGTRALLVDDLLATGGTARASVALLANLDVDVVECAFLVELAFLHGAERLAPAPCFSLVRYDA